MKPGGSPKTRLFLGQTPFGGNEHHRILLAGEYTNPTDAGMVHGAYQEGIRAAEQCLNLLSLHEESTSEDKNLGRTVVVIGAGASGLACAKRLLREDLPFHLEVIVLEARDRIGGRVNTTVLSTNKSRKDEGGPDNAPIIELGANWLQQGRRNPLYSEAIGLGLKLVETDFLAPKEFPRQRAVKPERVRMIMEEFSRRSNNLVGLYRPHSERTNMHQGRDINDEEDIPSLLPDHESDVSLETVLRSWLEELSEKSKNPSDSNDLNFTPEEILHVIAREVCVDAGVPLSDLSSKYGMEPSVGEGDFWIVNGYRQVLEELALGVNVQLNSVVQSIAWDPLTEKFVVEALEGTEADQSCYDVPSRSCKKGNRCILADHVVCTIPAAVLERGPNDGGILFDPPMPSDHRKALRLLTTGWVEKVALQFQERWWPKSTSGYIRAYGEKFGDVSEWLDCSDVYGVPVISGLFSGPWLEDIWYNSEGKTRDNAEIAKKATLALATSVIET